MLQVVHVSERGRWKKARLTRFERAGGVDRAELMRSIRSRRARCTPRFWMGPLMARIRRPPTGEELLKGPSSNVPVGRLVTLFLLLSILPLAALTYSSVHLASSSLTDEVKSRVQAT